MLFNSWVFACFLPLVLVLYRLLPRGPQNLLLLGASYVFYGFWDERFLVLILFSTSVDYFVARALEGTEDERKRKGLLGLSIGVNLGLLGFFKYFHFFVDSAVMAAGKIGLELSQPTLQVILPIGISFYTLQTLSYTVDVYRREFRAERHFTDFALFVCFFPQLVAGPIERAQALLPQIKQDRRTSLEDLRVGAWLLLKGFFLKMVVADNLAVVVDEAYDGYGTLDGAAAIAATYAFTFQLYGDFAGYSNIARGSARILGIRLRQNFAIPYLARNPAEFWRRWHISLSTWLRDYLYISLGGSRKGRVRTILALLATMVLSGLWHGANWTFAAWGFFHGLWLVLHRVLRSSSRLPLNALRTALGVFLTFHFWCFSLVLFRAHDLGHAGQIYAAMVQGPWLLGQKFTGLLAPVLMFGGLLWILDLWTGNRDEPREIPGWRWGGPILVSLMLLLLLVLSPPSAENFVYFQF